MLSLAISFVNMCIGRNGGAPQGGGPYLLKVDGASRILLAGGSFKLMITGTAPASGGFVPTFHILGF